MGERNNIILAAVLVVLGVACAGLQLYASLNYDLNPDEVGVMHIGWLLLKGEKPFIDFMEHHPLLFFYLFVPFAKLGTGVAEFFTLIRVFSWCCWLATMGAVWMLLRNVASRIACAVALVLLALHWPWSMDLRIVRSDIAMIPIFLLSLALLLRGWRRRSPGLLAISGAVYGLALAVLPKVILFAPPIALWMIVELLRERDDRRRLVLLWTGWIASCCAVGGGILLLYILIFPDFWFWNVTFNQVFPAAMEISRGVPYLLHMLRVIVLPSPMLAALAVFGAAVSIRKFARSGALLIAIGFAFYFVMAWWRLPPFTQYYLPLYACLAFFAAIGVDRIKVRWKPGAMAVVISVGVALAGGQWFYYAYGAASAADRLNMISYMLDVSKEGDRFLACPPYHPVMRYDAGYVWMNYAHMQRAFDRLGDERRIDWREGLVEDPPEWIIPFYPRVVDWCYTSQDLPRELLDRYDSVEGPVPLLRLKSARKSD